MNGQQEKKVEVNTEEKIAGRSEEENYSSTDLSNMPMPMYNIKFYTYRKLQRLQNKVMCFNVIFMLVFLFLFVMKAYFESKNWYEINGDINWLLVSADVLLMIGSIVIFCFLGTEKYFNKCFVALGIIYALASAGISASIQLLVLDQTEQHYLYLIWTQRVQMVCSSLAVVFLSYLYLSLNKINYSAKREQQALYDSFALDNGN